MFSFEDDNRKMNDSNLMEIVNSLITLGWHPESTMTVSKEKGESKAVEKLALVLKDDKKYRIVSGEDDEGSTTVETYNKDAIIAKVAQLPEASGEFEKVVSGFHRGLAVLIALAFGHKVKPKLHRVSAEEAYQAHVSGNALTETITRLNASEKLPAILEGIQQGTYKKESDLPFKRGTNQKLWNQARLVRAGVDIESAKGMNKENARKAMQSADPKVHVAKVLDGNEPAPAPIMKSGEIRDLYKMAQNRKVEGDVLKILECIIEDNQIEAEGLIQSLGK